MDSTSSYKLDTPETTATLPPPNSFKAFTDDSDREEIEQVRLVYACLSSSVEPKKVRALDNCRSSAWFIRHATTGIVKVATNQCHVRFCPFCGKKRQAFLTHQVSDWLKTAKYPKMLTVTLKHGNAPLSHQLHHLYDSFRRLRSRSYVKKRIRGGVWFFQIKKSKKDHKWHPHIHALIDGDYLARENVSKLWHDITLTSDVVDIRTVKDADSAARHTARYAATPSALKDLDLPDACELVSALRGRRLCGTWGSARSITLRPQPPEDASEWKGIGSWSLVVDMQEHSENARAILKSFLTGEPLDEGIECARLEKEIYDGITEEPNPPPKQYQHHFFE